MSDLDIESIREKYPFLTYIRMGHVVVGGIVLNVTTKLLTIYQLDLLREQREFLDLGAEWWASDRSIPISLYIGGDRFEKFDAVLRTYAVASIVETIGPTYRLADHFPRKLKKSRYGAVRSPRKVTWGRIDGTAQRIV
jgi:hypothetical protein